MDDFYGISCATSDDFDGWMLLVDIVSDDFPGLVRNEYEKVLQDCISKRTAICAKNQDRVIGLLLFSLENGTLSFLAVHPDYRGSGIATDMIKTMIRRFPQNERISVTTYREGDAKGEVARKLYKKIGFIEDELVEEFDYPCQRFVFGVKGEAKNNLAQSLFFKGNIY